MRKQFRPWISVQIGKKIPIVIIALYMISVWRVVVTVYGLPKNTIHYSYNYIININYIIHYNQLYKLLQNLFSYVK